MQRILRRLEKRGIDLASLHVLEVFGQTGVRHTLDFASRVASLEVWEIDPGLESALQRNLPKAAVRILDSYSEIKQARKRFDLIVIDNPMSICDGHCEHFDLFPDLFCLAADEAILILDVMPSLPPAARKKYPYLFNEEQRARRREFYHIENADDLSWETIISAYRMQAERTSFNLEWSFTERRHFIYYLALKISR